MGEGTVGEPLGVRLLQSKAVRIVGGLLAFAASVAVVGVMVSWGARLGFSHRPQLRADSPINVLLMVVSVGVGAVLGLVAAAVGLSMAVLTVSWGRGFGLPVARNRRGPS